MLRDVKVCLGMVENACDAIFAVDKEGRVIYQNPEARRLFGYEDEEIVGHSILEKIHHHYPDGEEVPEDHCKVYRATAYGEVARDFTWLVWRKDGTPLYVACNASPLHMNGQHVGATFVAADITEKRKAEAELRDALRKLELANTVAGVGFYRFNLQTGEMDWSDVIKEQFGLPPDAIVTLETCLASIHPDDRMQVVEAIEAAKNPESGGLLQHEYRTIGLVDGKTRWIISRGQVFFENGVPSHLVGATVDITDRKVVEESQRRAAQHDPLTGLANRALLVEYADHLLAMAERDNAECAVLFIDLDRFKPINDLYGHEAGDKVLQEIASRLRQTTRKEDIVSRLGGDEFVVLLPHVDSPSDPQIVAKHLLERIGRPIRIGANEVSVSPSIGISLYPKHGKSIESLIRCADAAMYEAKRGGKNTFRTYIPGDEEKASADLQLEMHLKHAVESKQMRLFYQPIIDMHTGQLAGVEALLRMRGVNGDLLLPDQFIPIAESAGLIDKLGQWVADEACKQHQAWREAGMPPLSISINVSSLEFRQRSFAQYLIDAIVRYDMDPTFLQIELTESAVLDNLAEAVGTLKELRALGISVALDDFGTGYSSLSYLSALPLDKLKIDQSFIKMLDTNDSSRAITDTIIGLGRLMNLEVIGEGIESELAFEYLREHGCDQAQGYLFSQPLPAHEFESWYRHHPTQLH